MNIFKKCAVKALSLAVALITALSVGVSASAAVKTPEIMSNDWSILVVFFKSVDVKVELNGKKVSLKKTVTNEQIDDIKNDVLDRMPYQFMQDTHGKVGIDVIDYAYVDEPLTNKDIEKYTNADGSGYIVKEDSKLASGVLDECLEQNFYSQILIFAPLGEINPQIGGVGGSKYSGVNIAHIILFDYENIGYYPVILHEICHGLETDSNALNNNRTAPLHDMYVGNNAGIADLDWYEYYMNDIRPDGKKGVEPMAFYRLRSEKHTPLAGKMTVTAPQNLSAAAKSDTAATLSWVGITGNGYQVGIFKDADHKKLKTTIDKKANETSATLTDLKKGNTYYLGVRAAMTANGKTFYSDWTYLAFNFDDENVLFDGSVPRRKTKTPTSILSLSATVKTQAYTGEARTPDVTIKDGSKTLKNGKDYALIYKNNTEIGTASVKVEAMGDYCDEGTLYFLIVPKKTTLTAKRSGGKITLQWDAVKGAEKYEICYREKDIGKYKVLETVSEPKTSYSTSKLDKNKTYQFKIRSYAELGGKKYCSSYSKVVTVK